MKKIKLRFKVAATGQTAAIDVDTSEINEPERDLLSMRLWGIDVLQLWNDDHGTTHCFDDEQMTRPVLIEAKDATLASLLAAVTDDQRQVKERQRRHMDCAWAMAVQGFDRQALRRPRKAA